MQKLRAKTGISLAIASFAMMLVTQWLHSPLHHLVESIEPGDQQHHQCEEQKKTGQAHCHSHTHHGSNAHTHCHSHSSSENEKSDANSKSGPPCNHHHPGGDCKICQFLAEKVSHSQMSVELTGTESVDVISDSAVVVVLLQIRCRFFVRGPPSRA